MPTTPSASTRPTPPSLESWQLLFPACAALLTSCGGGGGSGTPADFALTLGQPGAVQAGGQGSLSLLVQRTSGHTATLSLSLETSGSGITGS